MGQKKTLSRKAEPPSEPGIRWPRWTGFRGKTVWDFLQLLIVPLMLVAIGLVFSLQQDARQQRVEDQRAEAERELAEQRAQDEALQAYLDQMSQLILERKLLEVEQGHPVHEPGDPVHTLAQARTSTAILRLDAEHNESVTRFLINSGLAESSEASARLLREITLSHATLSDAYLPNTDLIYADLSGANLRDADLYDADLSGANLRGADLSSADLSGANLFVADLTNANLSDAFLRDADLKGADLSGANLNGANLTNADLSDGWNPKREANLSGTGASYVHPFGANLSGAKLSGAYLNRANLNGADLSGADLSGAHLMFADLHDADLRKVNLLAAWTLTEGKIAAARSLKGATMPNGQKYEDWLKEKKARGKDEKNE